MMATVLLLVSALVGCQEPGGQTAVPRLDRYELGGDFSLVDQDGRLYQLNQHRGQVLALFFGYTHCPDFCPLTLSKLTEVQALLEQPLQVLFVTVDPERDDAEQLRHYLSSFDLPVTGLTGEVEQVAEVARRYGAGYQRHQSDPSADYTMDHSTRSYLIDGDGVVRYLFSKEDSPERIAAVVAQLH